MPADKELLCRYAKGRDESAFAELVRRHLSMVYSAALRQVAGDTHLAEDVCQAVFSDLARKAGQLSGRASIAGWLYTSARFAASKTVRLEVRRRNREDAAAVMNPETPNIPWAELRDLLDAAMNELGEKDREAIVLRYFEARDLAIVGAALGMSANAARMRVDRALNKLRCVLQKRGVTATSAALAAALAGAVSEAVPAGLACVVSAPAVTTAPTAGAGGVLMMAAAAIVGASLVAVLLRQVLSAPEGGLGAPPEIASAENVNADSPEMKVRAPRGDPLIFQKIAKMHEAQVREHKGTANDWFSRHMRDEPGVKKYGARLQRIIAPGDTLVCGGWTIATGTRMLVLITPTFTTNGPDQVDILSRIITAPETMFDNPELHGFRGADNDSAMAQAMSTDTAIQLLKGSNVVVEAMPKVTTALGMEASIGIRDNPEGQVGYQGTDLDFNPMRATDGASVNLDMATCCVVPDGFVPGQ